MYTEDGNMLPSAASLTQAKDKSPLGIGLLSIKLEWFNTTDLDLQVYCPCGSNICFRSKTCSKCGGRLDRDANSTIYIANDHPSETVDFPNAIDGYYQIRVNSFRSTTFQPTPFKVTFSLLKNIAQPQRGEQPPPLSPLLWGEHPSPLAPILLYGQDQHQHQHQDQHRYQQYEKNFIYEGMISQTGTLVIYDGILNQLFPKDEDTSTSIDRTRMLMDDLPHQQEPGQETLSLLPIKDLGSRPYFLGQTDTQITAPFIMSS